MLLSGFRYGICVSARDLIVGLGNPGEEYEQTRHNIGFLLIDRIAGEAGAEVRRKECKSLVGKARLEGVEVELVKPQTFMNLSGEAVACLLKKQGPVDQHGPVIVISDDLALPFGKIRIRARGSAGGHNGLKSIIGALKTDVFVRLRIGIQPEHPVSDTKRFVLDRFSKSERDQLDEVLSRGSQAVRTVLRDGVAKAMSEFN